MSNSLKSCTITCNFISVREFLMWRLPVTSQSCGRLSGAGDTTTQISSREVYGLSLCLNTKIVNLNKARRISKLFFTSVRQCLRSQTMDEKTLAMGQVSSSWSNETAIGLGNLQDVHGKIRVLNFHAKIDKQPTSIDESSNSVLKYRTPNFRYFFSGFLGNSERNFAFLW